MHLFHHWILPVFILTHFLSPCHESGTWGFNSVQNRVSAL